MHIQIAMIAIASRRKKWHKQLEKEAVQSRLDAQLSNDERVAQADIVIVNNGSEEELLEQLDEQWHRLMSEE